MASDDVSRLYISDMSGENKGWAATKSVDWIDYILIGSRYVQIDDVFDGILYAD